MLRSSTFFSTRRGLAVAVALFAAGLFVQFDPTPRAAPTTGVAGEAMMRVLGDEHAAIAGYLKQEAAARAQADQMATRDLEKMKLAALDDAQPSSLRLAQAAAPAREGKVKAGIVRAAAKSEPVRVTSGPAVTGEPMQLTQLGQASAPPPPRPPLVHVAVGAVSGKLRQLAATVERVPSWLVSAGDWVSDAVPVSRRTNWPSHEFRATL